MKCPKCGYLGFEHVERCRNCGYDFSLSASSTLPDLSIRSSRTDEVQPLADLELVDGALNPVLPNQLKSSAEREREVSLKSFDEPAPELPLFGGPIVDDVPLITRASPPRTPLAVRRATPEVPRVRSDARAPMLDLTDFEPDARRGMTPHLRWNACVRRRMSRRHSVADESSETAGCARGIDPSLRRIRRCGRQFTLQFPSLAEIDIIPKVPLLTFLTLQNFSYFVAFTVAGQTLGQMALGIKVVSNDRDVSPDLRRALLRTVVWLVLAIPAGLGLLTVLFSSDHRGLHDRWADTRVVRAGA
jgi:hypothetical protein